MDTSDPNIIFNDDGVCDFCVNYEKNIAPVLSSAESHDDLMKLADSIKKANINSDFDCIIGLSGGLDSSYTAYVAKEIMGLRPLLFHVDAGWNTDRAVANIEKLVDGLGLDLYTEVINWNEMKDLQRSFFYSQIPDQDLPQDAAFFSALYKFANKHKIKYVLTGSNHSTECCREPEEWGGYLGIDKILFKDIHTKFGTRHLDSFPLIDILEYKIKYQCLLGMKVVKPLDLMSFNKIEAEEKLNELFGWQKFQHKHHESRFTRFYEDFWLPKKFGFEKRRAHFSSLISTGQMDREDAVARISSSECTQEFLKLEMEFIADKLDFSLTEFTQIFNGTNKTFKDYKNKRWLIKFAANGMRTFGLEKRLFR
jgi:putative aminotransferase